MHAKFEPLLPRSASFGTHKSRVDMLKDAWSHYSPITHLTRVCASQEDSIKAACIGATTVCFVIGLLGVLNPFSLLTPLHLVTSLYIVALSALALTMEVDVAFLEALRREVERWVRGLTCIRGRGALYIVLGTLTAGLGDPLAVVAGLIEMGVGGACFVSNPTHETAHAYAGELPERAGTTDTDAPRLAFKRRVVFGMEQMDSAEFVALCLELGLSLDARARAAALAVLDPHQEGCIEEETFMAWWEQQQPQSPLPPQPLALALQQP